jgi:hypothetical protein
MHSKKKKPERLEIKWALAQKELLAPLGETGAQTLHVFVAKMFAELSMKCALFARSVTASAACCWLLNSLSTVNYLIILPLCS